MRRGTSSGPRCAMPMKPATRVSARSRPTCSGSAKAGYTPGGLRSGPSPMSALPCRGRPRSDQCCPHVPSSTALARLVDLLVDASDLAKPHVPLLVLHVEDVVEGPVKVVRDVRDLLVKLLARVRGDRPRGHPWPAWPSPPSSSGVMTAPVAMSISISRLQPGQLTLCLGAPSSLIFR